MINVSKASVFSSLLEQRAAAVAFDANATSTGTEEVTVATLDQFAPAFAGRACFLKIDTQGYERQVLLGAKATLPMLQGIQLELPIIHLYAGVWGLPKASNSCWIEISWSLRFIRSICTGLIRCLG